MGQGIDAARAEAPLHAEVLDNFKGQLLIVLLRRLGGNVSIPVTEVDDTGGVVVLFNIENNVFNFEIRKKQ